MIAEALAYIREKMSPAIRYQMPDGSDVFDHPVFRAPEPEFAKPVPLATALIVSTLASFAEYLGRNMDALNLSVHVVHVAEPGKVLLVSSLESFHRRRETALMAHYESPALPYLDKWLSLEDATVGLMTVFTGQEGRDGLLAMLKSVKSERAEIREDDGLAQKVNVMAGVTTVATVKVPNPVLLAPYRSFPGELGAQPVSPFVVRLRDGQGGVEVIFKSADGGAWEVAAVEAVAQFLEAKLAGADGTAAEITVLR